MSRLWRLSRKLYIQWQKNFWELWHSFILYFVKKNTTGSGSQYAEWHGYSGHHQSVTWCYIPRPAAVNVELVCVDQRASTDLS